jgi:hypothetical protein
MLRRVGRFLLILLFGVATGLVAAGSFHGGLRGGMPAVLGAAGAVPATCREADPAWTELGVDLSGGEPIEPGRVVRLSDGTLAVLVVVTQANETGEATAFDFAASVRVAAVIVRAGEEASYTPFDPPVRNASGLAAPGGRGITRIAFCYHIQVPNPPPPGATTAAEPTAPTTPIATATATAETFEIDAVQTAHALATEAAGARATAAAFATAAAGSEATRSAEAQAASATAAGLATERAAAAAATSTADAAARAAARATADTAVAAAQATTAALATADAERQSELATSQAAQTEAAATIAALQTAAIPSPTPTPTVPVYGAWSGADFAQWPDLPDGWTFEGDQLLAGGPEFKGYVQPPAFALDTDDYAVEIEAKVLGPNNCAGNFGIVIRGSESGYYAGGVEWACDQKPEARLWTPQGPIAASDFTPDGDWHIFRVEAKGNRIRFLIDGQVVLERQNDAYPHGSQVALWSSGVKLKVRAFRVVGVA